MKTILVVFGGRSAEHDVSIITAHIPIMEALRASGIYQVAPLYIAKDGSWYSEPELGTLETFRAANVASRLAKFKKVQLAFNDGLSLVWPGFSARSLKIDVVFPAMHGTYGEDGSLMGLLRMAGVPFVGCDLDSSAVAMDKVLTKQVTGAVGLPSVKYEWFYGYEWAANESALTVRLGKLKYPVFVKPVHLGSSIGITRVATPADLANAVEVALHYDDKVIVEEAVTNLIELTVPVMGAHGDIRTALVEKALNKTDFFDFNDKYIGHGKSKGAGQNYSELPAKLPEAVLKQATELAKAAFVAIGGGGMARIDLLLDSKSGAMYLNEINTLPGSLYHHNWRAAGVAPVELVTRLVELGEARFLEQQKLVFTFDSTILAQVPKGKLGL